MRFYKRKLFFLPLFLVLILFAIFLAVSDNLSSKNNKASSMQAISGDTTETVQVEVEEFGVKKDKIRLEDQGSPKTVNLILYLIYRLTFKNAD